jgi:hypothetical protein
MREQIGRYKCNGLCSSLIAFLKYFLLLFTCKGSIERLIKKQQQNLEEIASQQQRRRRRKNFTSGVCTVPVGNNTGIRYRGEGILHNLERYK